MSNGGTRPPEDQRRELGERYRSVDGRMVRQLTEAALTWLRTNQQIVNSLNVFPVPDGDTGTNMTLTMQSAIDALGDSSEPSAGKVAKALAHGALMGARGNSGVILSQLWRGLARSIDDESMMDAEAFAHALAEARDTAYKGVVHPVEGTILTVAKDSAQAAQEALDRGATSALDILERVVEEADASVQRTPDLLPVLRDAGVVDSGGKGLFFILEGMLRFIYGLPLDRALATVQPLSALKLQDAAQSVEPGQDWEVVIDFRPSSSLDIQSFYARLEEIGTSIQVGEGDGIYRMHIHVPTHAKAEPEKYVESLGTINRVMFENLMEQMAEQPGQPGSSVFKLAPVTPGQLAVVAVAPGSGIAEVFASLGVAAIVEGGQTMNPSMKDILSAVEALPTDRVIILPNNKNIVLAAEQASGLTSKSLAVVPTTSVPQGIAALLALDPDGEIGAVSQAMGQAVGEVKTVEMTVATRSVELDGVQANEGQVIGLLNGKLAVSGDDLEAALLQVLEKAGAPNAELISLYYGAGLTAIQANKIADRVRETWPRVEVEIVRGGQPHYQFIASLE
ncbi:MAG: DAK2 domain-containing protein [Chloroflexi bacterium]|nr:DAK2 domain-containing protein [Chloroflexota bacterium]